MSDDHYYETIADELEMGTTNRVLWTRAIGESGGDIEKAKAFYIRLRFAELKKVAPIASSQPRMGSNPAVNGASVDPAESRLIRLRANLADMLVTSKAPTFYSVLGVPVGASDAEVIAAITDYEIKVALGKAVSSPEFNYAKKSLGNPVDRENYDRRLLERLQQQSESISMSSPRGGQPAEPESIALSMWGSRKTSLLIGAIAFFIVGYLILGFYREREASAARKKAIDAQVIETTKAAEIAATRAESERALVDGVVKNDGALINNAAQLENRSLDIQQNAENRRRQELEYRANAGSQILEMQRQQQDRQLAMQEQRLKESQQRAEANRIDREKRYWACMNAALDRMDSAKAGARCAGYR